MPSPQTPPSSPNSSNSIKKNVTFSMNDVSNNHIIDSSHNIVFDLSGSIFYDLSGIPIFDISGNVILPHLPPIVVDVSSSIITGDGYKVTNIQGTSEDGSLTTQTIFTTTDINSDVNINENLSQKIETYNDELDPNNPSEVLLNRIKSYASQINCEDFHGKGSIDDYTTLFQAASKIATESKHMELDVDTEGFAEFAEAADSLSSLFTSFITKLQNVNIITDITFLTSVANALEKIVNLAHIFGKFKETIIATSTIQLPKSAHDAAIVINDVMDEVNCAMGYIQYFVNPVDMSLNGAELSQTEQNIINQSINTINSWNVLCEQGVSIAMANDPDVQTIQQASNSLKNTAHTLQNATTILRGKLANLGIHY